MEQLHSRPRFAAAVERDLSRHAPIRHAFANPLTGRLLVGYDPGVQPAEVRDRVRAALGVEPATPDELREWRSVWPRGFDRAPEELAVDEARRRLILSGTFFAGVVAKRLLFGAGAFAGAPAFVTASAVLTIIGGYAALRRGAHFVTGPTSLNAAALGVLAVAESLDGIGALVAAHAGEWFLARTVRDTRSAVQMLDSWWERDAVPAKAPRKHVDAFEKISTAALIASGGAYLVTGDAQQSLAMLVGACPVAERESLTTAHALSLSRALAAGILFRDPDSVSALPRVPALVFDGPSALRNAPRDYGQSLQQAGAARTILLTSESPEAARAAARDAGLDEWHGGLDVARKFDALQAMRDMGFAPLVIAGDEDGDTELLGASDLGFAFVARSAPETLHAAGVLLLDAEPWSVVTALALMHRTSRIVCEDEWLSRLVGVAGFTAATFGKLSAAGASHLHNYTRLAMELNSLRLVFA